MSDSKKENREIELKLTLSSFCDYLKLLGFIGEEDARIQQTNIFYDTKNRDVSKLGYALRLRILSSGGVVTLKSSTVQTGKAAVRKEIEASISHKMAKEIQETHDLLSLEIAPILFLLSKKEDLAQVSPLLQFENERIKKEVLLQNRTYIFEIDKTTYTDGQVDYELEIELESLEEIENAEFDLQKLFKSLEIDFKVQKKSKFERALEIAQLL